MTDEKTLAPALVARAGEALLGANWQNPLADLLGLNQRNVRRIAQAAREGRDYPVSPGLLAELAGLLEAREADARAAAAAITAYLEARPGP